jgi:hypothetical protein
MVINSKADNFILVPMWERIILLVRNSFNGIII